MPKMQRICSAADRRSRLVSSRRTSRDSAASWDSRTARMPGIAARRERQAVQGRSATPVQANACDTMAGGASVFLHYSQNHCRKVAVCCHLSHRSGNGHDSAQDKGLAQFERSLINDCRWILSSRGLVVRTIGVADRALSDSAKESLLRHRAGASEV